MPQQPDIPKPADDQFSLMEDNWIQESENAYRTAEGVADDASSSAAAQANEALTAESKMVDEKGLTAERVADGYASAATDLLEQSRNLTAVSGWMVDAANRVSGAKGRITDLVLIGTSEVRAALESELRGTPASPSSNELIAQYRADISSLKTTLESDLDGIGHSLSGTPGSSRTPSYTSIPTSPTAERPDPRATVTAYNSGRTPEVTPKALPEMPRAVTAPTTESPSAPSTPTAPAAPHPTLSNLVGGGQGNQNATGTPSAASPHTPSSPSTPSPQAHQSTEQHHQAPKPAGLPRIPSLPLDGLPAAAAESVATMVTSASGHQLSTAPSTTSTTITPSVPASTGITPGTAGTPPVTPVTPGLTPIGGGGLSTPPPVTQPAAPAVQGTPASPTTPSPTPTRSPVVDAAWIQQRYGLAPGIESPKSETALVPALFITDLPDDEVHLHRVLASLCHQFEQAGWAQPLAVASIRRGFETRCVYVTADGVSIHPHGVLLPDAVGGCGAARRERGRREGGTRGVVGVGAGGDAEGVGGAGARG
ncbi:hypothetical protein [Mycobacteroides sp. H001]|uniref:hypothetical protein n=1 Tax=Mycobacteroides sp. H001 TaxID=1720565 RepID=UPI0013F4FAD1|nr:hypothetical protein [Mycobacteroides sp. H001]